MDTLPLTAMNCPLPKKNNSKAKDLNASFPLNEAFVVFKINYIFVNFNCLHLIFR